MERARAETISEHVKENEKYLLMKLQISNVVKQH